MADYIDREAVVEAVKRCKQIGNTAAIDKFDVLNRVKIMPAADVKPIVRGEWRKELSEIPSNYGYTPTNMYVCSSCGALFHEVGYGYNFCPNCGANMRGAQND